MPRLILSQLERCFEDAAQFLVGELHRGLPACCWHAGASGISRPQSAAERPATRRGGILSRCRARAPGDSVPGVGLAVAGQGPGDFDVPLDDGRVAPFVDGANVGLHDEGEEPGAEAAVGLAGGPAQDAGEPDRTAASLAFARAVPPKRAARAMSSRAATSDPFAIGPSQRFLPLALAHARQTQSVNGLAALLTNGSINCVSRIHMPV